MTDQEVNKASEEKTAEVAPYLSAKKEDEKETSKANTIIPAIIIFAVAVTVIASFFEDEYKSVIASFSTDTKTAPASEEVISADTTEITKEEIIVAGTAETSQKMAAVPAATIQAETTPAVVENVAIAETPVTASASASAQTENQPGLITMYNPYLKPYPQVYAPIPVKAPYGMPPQQAKAYTEMMKKRQVAVARMVEMRNAAMERRDQQRAQAQKAHAEMMKRRQTANRI
jgi:hypothetical protein